MNIVYITICGPLMLINPVHWAFSLLWPVKLLTAEGILSFIIQNTELFLKIKSMSTPSYSPKPPPPPIPIPPSPALSPYFHLYLFALVGRGSHRQLITSCHYFLALTRKNFEEYICDRSYAMMRGISRVLKTIWQTEAAC